MIAGKHLLDHSDILAFFHERNVSLRISRMLCDAVKNSESGAEARALLAAWGWNTGLSVGGHKGLQEDLEGVTNVMG